MSYITHGTEDELIKHLIEERDNMKLKVQVGNRVFGIPEKEYKAYLGELIGKKVDEVIYQLNISKYVEGLQEYDEYEKEVLEKFEDAKEKIIEYYSTGSYITECSGLTPTYMSTVTSMYKSDITEEIGEDSGSGREVTDSFILTANANYLVRWEFKYTINNEGKIASEVECSHKAIINW